MGAAAGGLLRGLAGGVRRCALALGLLAPAAALAWSNHALISGPALRALPEFAALPAVPVEPLEAFLVAQGARLEQVLEQEESWARAHVHAYAARPDALRYRVAGAADAAELRRRFVAAVRIAPDARLALFVQRGAIGEPDSGRTPLATREVTTLPHDSTLAATPFVALRAGEPVRPLEIVTSASDEPDYGLDIGLWSDNGTPQGRAYGFGPQPFGNPALAFGTQAPFHMGFFHESRIVYLAAGFLERTYPEYRIHLWKTLAEHALRSGHGYWGWRFAGWAMHYLQDLTQPYHARVLPGVGTVRMLWINTLHLAGWPRLRDEAVTLVSNRHLAFENFQRTVLWAARRDPAPAAALFEALGDAAADPQYDDDSARGGAARRSAAAADALDATLAATLPARYVSDPGFEFGAAEQGIDLEAQLARGNPAGRAALVRALAPRLADAGAYSRALLRSVLAAR